MKRTRILALLSIVSMGAFLCATPTSAAYRSIQRVPMTRQASSDLFVRYLSNWGRVSKYLDPVTATKKKNGSYHVEMMPTVFSSSVNYTYSVTGMQTGKVYSSQQRTNEAPISISVDFSNVAKQDKNLTILLVCTDNHTGQFYSGTAIVTAK